MRVSACFLKLPNRFFQSNTIRDVAHEDDAGRRLGRHCERARKQAAVPKKVVALEETVTITMEGYTECSEEPDRVAFRGLDSDGVALGLVGIAKLRIEGELEVADGSSFFSSALERAGNYVQKSTDAQ